MTVSHCMEFDAVVTDIVCETSDTKTLRFTRPPEFTFIPGQFVNVTLRLPGGQRVRRAYSIASSPLEGQLDLTVRRLPDGLVSAILTDEVTVGESLSLKGPYGRFLLEDKRMMWVAGGSGIVPFRSMWRYIDQKALSTEFVLLYAIRDVEHAIYRSELNGLLQAGRSISCTFTREAPCGWTGLRGRIDRTMLQSVVPDFRDIVFYACGPPAMCRSIVCDLTELGVPRVSIRTEEYD
jgi:glycine betaine catabolism B